MSDDEPHDRGVDVEKLLDEISALRDAAVRYGQAVAEGRGVGAAGRELEAFAVRYTRKLDEELAEAQRPNYAKIFEDARREQERREN